jgi:type VI protein secretion system component VasK
VSTTARRAADELTSAPRLLWAASPVLLLIGPLRATRFVSDLANLRAGICAKLDAFERQAQDQGVGSERAVQAREALAALIDQVVLTTPWGADAGWRSLSGSLSQSPISDPGIRELISIATALVFSDASASQNHDTPPTMPIARSGRTSRPSRYVLLGASRAGKSSARAGLGAAAVIIDAPASDESSRVAPLEGALIAICANDLLELGSDQLTSQARALRSQLEALEATLGSGLPVHLMLTKCDLLLGFLDWFGTYSRLDRDRPLSLALDPDRWADELADVLLDRLLRERDAQRRFRIAAFVLQVRALGQPLERFLHELSRPVPKRVFLTSATQAQPVSGAWLDRSTSGLELERLILPSNAGPAQSFFLSQLMNEVLAEGVVSATQPRHARAARSMVSFAVAASLLLGGAFGIWKLRSASPANELPRASGYDAQLSQQIAARIAVPCIELVAGTFPFDRRADREAPLEEFNRLFAPQGMFDNLDAQLRARQADLSRQDLERFRSAARIRDAFFPGGRKHLGMQLTLRVISMDPAIERIDLELEGQALRFARGESSTRTLSWPGTGANARLEISPATLAAPLEYQGHWALFRLFDRAMIKESSVPGHLSVVFDLGGKQAAFDVQSEGTVDPFQVSELQSFDCPI